MTSKKTIGIVNTNKAIVRSFPDASTESNIIDFIDKDIQVFIEECDNPQFYKILAKAGDEGFCLKENILLRED